LATRIKQGVKLAECMRAHGLRTFPDPTTLPPSTLPAPNAVFLGGPDGSFSLAASMVQSPAFKQAAGTCGFPFPASGRGFTMPVAAPAGWGPDPGEGDRTRSGQAEPGSGTVCGTSPRGQTPADPHRALVAPSNVSGIAVASADWTEAMTQRGLVGHVGRPRHQGRQRSARYPVGDVDLPEQTFGTLKQAGTPKLVLTLVQLLWALLFAILGGHLVGSSSVGDVILGAFLLCATVGVALHAILWLRTRVVVSPARVEIVDAFRRRTVAKDQLDRFELGTNIQGRPVAVLRLRSGKRKKLYATASWWGKRHRQAVQSTVAQMNEAAGISQPETPRAPTAR
jgi:hypothetical protein